MENSKIPNISLFTPKGEKGLQVGKICTKKAGRKKAPTPFFCSFQGI